MSKKMVFSISIFVNIVLAIVFFALLFDAAGELKFEYVEQETIRPDTLRKELERERYGSAAWLSRPIRGGAVVAPEYEDYYRLGAYTDLLFMKEVFDRAGHTDTVTDCEKKLIQIREEMPDYGALLDKIEQSTAKAVVDPEKDGGIGK